ncbi:hypothetical protein [Winogradskyella vidalii]|uniref:hypothetical protein n=1 Tax=Winogradskyella vidalii TaxID=2615024 RepID=UPI0015CD5847|nr:hypothetical protein [Winogradskyella vidalii]
MELEKFILFRKKIQDFEITPYGFKGLYILENETDVNLISLFEDIQIREIFYPHNNSTANQKKLNVGDKVKILIDLSKFQNYFEKFEDFLKSNKYKLNFDKFYIYELDYHHEVSPVNKQINNFLLLQELINFLKKLSTYEKTTKGILELYFHKPDKICSILIDYDIESIKKLKINKSISELSEHVFEKSDQETRIKLFSNEMINLLSVNDFSFDSVLNNWESIDNSYRSSFQIYLSEFSFEKIKTSSQEYFHELTDRIYSTIHKFSGYILAIPVAYLLILRFFDFKGENLTKDSFLLAIGLLYFIIIWFVLLNNLSNAFETIEKDIDKFLNRIKGEENLVEITENLADQKKKLIPSQKKKIKIVRIISVLIFLMILCAYLIIYLENLKELIIKSPIANTVYNLLLAFRLLTKVLADFLGL